MAIILVVDDKPSMRKMLASALKVQGHKTVLASSGSEALMAVKKESFDLVLTEHVRMPDISGLDVLREVKALQGGTAVVIMTAFGTVETAVEAMKMGAADYLTKPFSLDQLKVAVDKALNVVSLKAENQALKAQVRDAYDFQGVLGESQAMRKVHQLITKVARVDSPVLVQGESGTGKELVAHAVHANSRRKGGPFLKVNCAALPEGLLESELFGHEKGAFTGAHERRLGRFELANGGTLFLDEVGEIPLGSQVKLLRVLQEKEFERVGGGLPIRTDVRVIAASNSDLKRRVASKLFREDLYFRLNVVPVFLPPLRERLEDIPPLAQHFLLKHALEALPAGRLRLAGETLKALRGYHFPGNVRELENIIQRAMVLVEKDGVILPRHLPKEVLENGRGLGAGKKSGEAKRFSSQVDGFQRQLILEALEKSGGSQTQAARQLGINRTLLIYKMKKYKIDPDLFKGEKKMKFWLGMTGLLALAGWTASLAFLGARPGAEKVVPIGILELMPQIKEAEEQFSAASSDLDRHQAETAPLVQSVLELKEKLGQNDVWWRRWWLSRRLSLLQEALRQIHQDEKKWHDAREALFRLYSGVVGEFSTALEKGLAVLGRAPAGRGPAMKGELEFLIRQKETWVAKLNRIGFSQDKPFRLAQLPEMDNPAVSGPQLADRAAVLKARSIQLKGWADLVQRDLRLYQGLRKARVLGAAGARRRILDLQATSRGVEMRMRINQEDLAKCLALLNPPKHESEPYLSVN